MTEFNQNAILLVKTEQTFENGNIFSPAVISKDENNDITSQQTLYDIENDIHYGKPPRIHLDKFRQGILKDMGEILFITPYPPRVSSLATYSHNLLDAFNNKLSNSFSGVVCALVSGDGSYSYPQEVKYILNTSLIDGYAKLATAINTDAQVKIILIQHEFDLYQKQEQIFLQFLSEISKPLIINFHTVQPHPDDSLKAKVLNIAAVCDSVIVMTDDSAGILINDYGLPFQKISVIAHVTHLAKHLNKELLKKKYGLYGRKVLTTFGLLSPLNSIETSIDALLAIIKQYPEVIFLIIGKTHPEVLKAEGEKYRKKLAKKVALFKLKYHVKFMNNHLALPDLIDYMQLTDIFLVTSKDPNHVMGNTFAYAMSCACPIISTPIPQARELLSEDTGIIFDFQNSLQLSNAVIQILHCELVPKKSNSHVMQKIVSTSWENVALLYTILFKKLQAIKRP